MSGAYRKVFTRIWGDEKFKELSDDGKILWFYFITSPHGHLSGLFVVDKLYILADLQWTSRRLNRAFGAIASLEMIAYDEKSRLLLIRNALKYDPITNENTAKHVVKHLSSLPNSPLIPEFCRTALSHTDDEKALRFLRENLKGFTYPLLKGSGEPLGKPIPYSGTGTGTGTEAVTPPAGTPPELPPDDAAPAGASKAPQAASSKGNSKASEEEILREFASVFETIPSDKHGTIISLLLDVRDGHLQVNSARNVLITERFIPQEKIDLIFPKERQANA
jgi:hypothetical protein